MGYSNNKWRKILTILMIINLCFILFTKITKVFGYTYYDETLSTNIEVPDSVLNDRNIFYFIRTNVTGGLYSVYLIQYDKNATLSYQYDENAGLYYRNKFHITGKYVNTSYTEHSKQDCINFIKNMPTYTLTQTGNNTILTFGDNVFNDKTLYFSNNDIKYYNSNNIAFNDSVFHSPYFDNVTEIEKGYPDGVFISHGDYSKDDALYFHLLQIDKGLSNSDQSIYYYSDKTFILNKDSNYYRTWNDPNIDGYYYYIPRYKLGLSQNTSYLYVLNNSKDQIQNSYGLYAKDIPNGIYDVIQSDTAGVITATEEETDRMKNIEETIVQNQGSIDNIQNSLSDTNVSQDTETNVDTSLNFDNSAPQFNSLFNGYFSRLTSIISDLGNYEDTDVITISIPIPFTNDTIPISSNFIFSNQNNNFLKNLATTLWYFIFGRYFLFFLINIYWLIANGQFFDYYLTQKEVITSDML